MRRAELPESIFDRLQHSLHGLEPDPLFRRRLRSSVVNYYVASREGHLVRPRRPRRQMGKLGRSVLYASVVLALGVSTVGAASQQSLPGDPLYGIKLRLEEIRMQIAPPSVRDTLAEMALAERTRELERLAASGAWDRVPDAAQRLASAESALLAIDPAAVAAPATDNALAVLQRVLADAPEAAQPGLQHAIEVAGKGRGTVAPPGHSTDDPATQPTPRPTAPPKPTQAAQPSPPGQDRDKPGDEG